MLSLSSTSIQGVVFDLDGTLYRLPAKKALLTLAIFSDVGLLRHLGPVREGVRGRTFASSAEVSRAVYEEMARRSGRSVAAVARWYEGRFQPAFEELLANFARVRPGTRRLLWNLRDRGVRLAVYSDFGRIAQRLNALRLPVDVFDDLVAAEDFGALKPAGRPLSALADSWGVETKSLVVVGDRLDLDARSAFAVGAVFLGVGKGRGFPPADGFVPWQEARRRLERGTLPLF